MIFKIKGDIIILEMSASTGFDKKLLCWRFVVRGVVMDKILEFMNTPYYYIICASLILFELYVYKKYNVIVGYAGEYYAKQELNKLSKDKYKVLNNILIEIDGKTYQIDHIVISKYGIFVIESKQYNGIISGSKYDKKWIRKGKNKDIFYTNPIRQNYGHVKAICNLLKLDESIVYNIVYIPSTAKLNIEHDGELVLADYLCDKIYSYQDIVLNNTDEIVEKIVEINITDKKRRKEHILYLKKNIKKVQNDECPKCGGHLIERNGKYGAFMGCSNYPKCKYTSKSK